MEKIKKNKVQKIEKKLSIIWDEDEDKEWENSDFWGRTGLLLFGETSERKKKNTSKKKENSIKNIEVIIHKILQQYIYCKRDRIEINKVQKSSGNYKYSLPNQLVVTVSINLKDEVKYEKIMNLSEIKMLLSAEYFGQEEYNEIINQAEEKIKKL